MPRQCLPQCLVAKSDRGGRCRYLHGSAVRPTGPATACLSRTARDLVLVEDRRTNASPAQSPGGDANDCMWPQAPGLSFPGSC